MGLWDAASEDVLEVSGPDLKLSINLKLSMNKPPSDSQWVDFSELLLLIQMSLPVVGTYLLQSAFGIVTVTFTGRLGVDDLAGATLGMLFANLTGVSTMIGMISAVDTLASQAYGMQQYQRVGIIAQRAALITGLMSVPIVLLWWNVHPLLVFLGQPPAVAAGASRFLRFLCPGLFPVIIYEIAKKYMQVQGIVAPVTCIMIASLLFNAAMTYTLVFPCQLGLIGSAVAVTASWTFMMTLSLLYIRFGHRCFPSYTPVDPRQCWGGWSSRAFSRWRTFLEIGLPSAGQICIEWWAIELITFEAGLLGVTALAASTIVVQLQTLLAMISLGIGISSSVVIGQRLGAGHLDDAKRSCRAIVLLALLVGTGLSALVFLIRNVWALAFTSDTDVAAVVRRLLLITGGTVLFDGVQIAMAGVLRGTGLQSRGAVVNFASQWLVGIPVGYVLTFRWGYGVYGLWGGQLIGTVLMAALSALIVAGIDWVKILRTTRRRAMSRDFVESPLHLE